MRTLAFDGRMGASGDMILSALIAVGADPEALAPVEAALPVRYSIGKTVKNGLEATTVDVLLTDDATGTGGREATDNGREDRDRDDHDHLHDHSDHDHHHHDESNHNHHDHDHSDHDHSDHDHSDHDHSDHDHQHSHGNAHAEGHGPHRSYAEVIELVESMALPAAVEANACGAFRLLGEAEATVHGESIETIHFHEVGADDAIADIVGVALLIDNLDVDRIVTTPLSVGGGRRSMSHGTYPIPGPAVVELAADAEWSMQGGPIEAELLTPTGAALFAQYADGVDHLPSIRVRESGYGAGDASFDSHPNVLRAILGDGRGRLDRESITVLETNLDDAAPEVLGGLQQTLKAVGARDVSILPATMKKSRPGHLVKVICKPEDAERVAHRLAVETGTLGVREHGAGHRWTARRNFETATLDVDGERYDVSVKIARTAAGEVYDVSAEYDDASTVAIETGLAIREVIRRAEATVEANTDAADAETK